MDIMKTVQVPATTRQVLEKTLCDFCGDEITPEGQYEVNEFKLSHRTGSNYPEGGHGEEWEVDLCDDCIKDKLIPWLKSQGAPVKIKDWDW